MRIPILRVTFGLFTACSAATAEEPYFDHNYAVSGIVRPGTSRISPETDAPERRADQMLQTEAPLPRKLPKARAVQLRRPKSFEGRFVNRQTGTEARDVPERLDETGLVQP